jgi:phosphopantetheine adenylyltransferase/dephospho-CoA kinase
VSPETLKGAEKCNDVRKQNNLKPLEIYIIQLIEKQETIAEKENKISSSNQRMDLLGTQFKKPHPRPNLPNKPYIIGLIGGVASGKSKMAARFEKMGAKIVDCDKLGHQIYEPGEDCYKEITQTFGRDVIGTDGRIDRKALGSKVFGKPEELEKLNKIVWPKILEKAKDIIRNSNEEVIILEAALLIQAGWEAECHEIWSCIIPPQEAIKRVMERNQMTEDEVKKRLASQPSNSTIVHHSNVVFSSLWSYEYSQQQAERAWKELKERLKALE